MSTTMKNYNFYFEDYSAKNCEPDMESARSTSEVLNRELNFADES
jgi:hypothetical protein